MESADPLSRWNRDGYIYGTQRALLQGVSKNKQGKEFNLKMRLGPIGLALATACILMMPLAAQQDANYKTTKIKVNEPVLIPGKVLAPGNYILSVLNSANERDIVEIRNADTDKPVALIIALNNFRERPTGTTDLEYWEMPAGDPPALRAWFYPDDQWGVEFAYPTKMAQQIAAHTQQPVPHYDAAKNSKLDMKTAKSVSLKDVPRKNMSHK